MYRVITSASWLGGRTYDDDRFEENADKLGLDIFIDETVSKLPGEYVILNQDTAFYHATSSENVDRILDEGLKRSSRKGKQFNGVYLTGSADNLSSWRGKDTVVLEVKLHSGTKVYQDFQPNAVVVDYDVPAEDIKLLS